MILQGKAAWVFPDSFDVDYIIGIPNIGLTDLKQITACLMKDFDPEFLDSCAPGDMLIAGKSFGYGHAHPQPMAGMREIGIRCVVAESYLFPFFRSELASGMMLSPRIESTSMRFSAISRSSSWLFPMTAGSMTGREPASLSVVTTGSRRPADSRQSSLKSETV